MRFLIVIACLAFSCVSFANTSSLQELFQNQSTVTIQPVVYEDLPVNTLDADKVCHILGFTRVVTKSVEPCTNGEEIWNFLSASSEATEMKASKCSSFGKKLVSLTCAGN